MKRAFFVVLAATACNVYDSSLLVGGDGGGGDATPEACASTCNNGCVDLQTDKNNCGSCGHACEVGCSAGVCTPTVLVSGLGAPHGLLLHGSSLYVANNGSINVQVMSKIDGTGLKNFATSQILPDRLATDGTTLFWTNDSNNPHPASGQIQEEAFDQSFCNVQSNATFCYLAQDLPAPYGIAVQGGNLFITTSAATNNAGNGCPTSAWASSVLSCPVIGGCATISCATSGGPMVLASGQTKLASITTDAANVYWADTGAGAVRFCPQPSCAGGPKTFVQTNGGEPFDVLSDGTSVFFTDRKAGTVSACPLTGCGTSPTVLMQGVKDPLLVAVDATAVYATSYAGGAVVACKRPCSGGAVTVAQGLKAPYGIALDATYVYWAEEGSSGSASTDGAVSKIKRPF
jgi:hypothetical protein